MNAKLEIRREGLFFDSKPFYLASGDMHYFRVLPGGWRRRLQLMKDFGLTAVQTYVPWNLHEPEEGTFRFDGNLDLQAFLALCGELGLKVMLRPGVYMCSEWDFGGLPYWLLNKPGIGIRTSDPAFMDCVRRYTQRLCREFVPWLSTNGGPIIAVAVENEYAAFSDDAEYMRQTGELLREFGVDVPLYTANGCSLESFRTGSRPEYWTGLDLHDYTEATREAIHAFQPDKPVYIAEYWAGRAMKVGGFFARQAAGDVAENYRRMLEQGVYINFYMFCGGTSFGFMNGASCGKYVTAEPGTPGRYIPQSTSYDVDAPVSEQGEPTAKYYACKRVLKAYLESRGIPFTGTPETEPRSHAKAQRIPAVRLTASADLLDNLENLHHGKRHTARPCTFEEMGQAYGFMLYRRRIEWTGDGLKQLAIDGLHDRALVYGTGRYLGCCMRDHESRPIVFRIPKEGLDLEILVENLGRVNVTYKMLFEHKGICGTVRCEKMSEDGTVSPWSYASLLGFDNYSLPMLPEDLERLDCTRPARENRPAVYRGEFEAEPGTDTFLDFGGWKKGFVFINGFNIGRYWNVGPQATLYVPGELLKRHNTIHVAELHNENPEPVIRFADAPSLDDTVTAPNSEAPLGY